MRADKLLLAGVLLLAVLVRVLVLPIPFNNVGLSLGNLDEISALAYATHLALEKSVLIPPNLAASLSTYSLPLYGESIMAYHPPLYYFLASAILLVTMPLALPQQILLLKLFSVLLGVGGIAFSYYLLRMVWGESVALSTSFLLAVWPTHVYLSTTINNYALILFLYPLFALLLFRGATQGFDFARTALVAVLVGLLALTHFTTLTSILVALAVLAWLAGKKALRHAAVFVTFFLLVAGGFYAFYDQVYGTYLPFSIYAESFRYMAGTAPAYFNRLFVYFFDLFRPHFAFNPLAPPAPFTFPDFPYWLFYFALLVLTLGALAGLCLLFRRFRGLPKLQQAFLLAGLVALLAMVGWQWYYEGLISPNGYHGRRLFDFLPFAPAFFVLGLKELMDKIKGKKKAAFHAPVLLAHFIFLGFLALYYFF